jgi:hypothetical protein
LTEDVHEMMKQYMRVYNIVLDRDINLVPKKRRLTFPQAMDIRLDALSGMSQKEVAIKHGVSQACVSLICSHKRHKVHR